jgi:tRNA A-37 threonylcarbamoyl transferase component Bud32
MSSSPNQHGRDGRQIPDDATQADLDAVWIDMRRRWRAGDRVPAEAYLSAPQAPYGESQIVDLIYGEFCLREESGEKPSAEEYENRFPRFAMEIRRQIAVHRALAETSDVRTAAGTQHDELHDESPMPPAIGKYRLVQKLGSGGQAWVYRAVHPTLGRDVVIKLSRRKLEDDWNGLDRLLDEGRALAELDHPYLARVYDLDVYDRRIYLVMEYIPGKNLEQYATDSPLTFHQAAAIVLKTAQAVAAAHRRGVTHCDIKPRNIVIDQQGQPRLLDFGLSRWENAWCSSADPGRAIAGTPQFLAPEQTRGQSAAVGPRTDVFALGGILYYLLSGHPPFQGHDLETVLRAAARCDFDRSILDKRRVPQRVKAVCLRAMSPRPEDRYQSADELARDLKPFVERQPRKRLLTALAVSLLALALGIALWAGRRALSPNASPRAGIASTAPAPVPSARPLLKVLVKRGHEYKDIADAAPVKNGDKLRIRLENSAGLFISLFRIDGQGQLHDVVVQSSRSQDQEFTYPPPREERDQAVLLTGAAGTEVLLACASRSGPIKHEALLKFLGSRAPWPKLPASTILTLENDKVVIAQSARDFGPSVDANDPDDPQDQVLVRLERLGKQLSGCETRLGIAFSHGDARPYPPQVAPTFPPIGENRKRN